MKLFRRFIKLIDDVYYWPIIDDNILKNRLTLAYAYQSIGDLSAVALAFR